MGRFATLSPLLFELWFIAPPCSLLMSFLVSAILMYNLGNELNYVGDEAMWKRVLVRVNMLMDYAREYQESTWGYLFCAQFHTLRV